MNPHVLRVHRVSETAAEVRHGPLLRDLLDVLVDGCRQATRLRVEGRSTAPGTIPNWLEEVASFGVVDVRPDTLILDAPPIADRIPPRFQRERGSDVDLAKSCLDLLEDSLEHAVGGFADSDRYDRHLMETLEAFGRLFRYGIDRFELINGRTIGVDKRGVETIRNLRIRTPADRRVIVAGKLETIRHSDGAFTLLLDSEEAIRGIGPPEQIDACELAALFGKQTVVTGIARFRPSGAVLRIEAERIRPAPADTSAWSEVPRPLDEPFDPRLLRKPQGPDSGISAIFGQWPGDESDEELLEFSREIS